MNDKKHREQHREFTDKDFKWGKEIDNKDLRYLLTKPGELSYSENERFGFYVYALIDVLCGNPHFCHYCENVREQIMGSAMVDMLKARGKFKGDKYPLESAPFNFLFRIGFNACSRWLKRYYQRKNAVDDACPMSLLEVRDQREICDSYSTALFDFSYA